MSQEQQIALARDDIKRLGKKMADMQSSHETLQAECAKIVDRLTSLESSWRAFRPEAGRP